MDIATIKTTGIDTVEFELQFSGASTEWIAIGLSTSASMFNTYVFLCYRTSSSSAVIVQERKTSNTVRSRPPVVTSNLDTISTSNSDGILNCKFTSPITRTPQLDDSTGYFVLLARGSYSSDIDQHANRCVGPRIQTADTASFQTTPVPTTTLFNSTSSSTTPSFGNMLIPSIFTVFISIFLSAVHLA